MYCSNCGKKLNGNEDFCPNCGYKIHKISKESLIKPLVTKIKSESLQLIKYAKKHQKIVGISVGCVLIFFICFGLFQTFYDFSKIKWDENAKDYEVAYTEGGVLELAVLAYDKNEEPITDITFETTGGKIEVDGGGGDARLAGNVAYFCLGKALCQKDAPAVHFLDDRQLFVGCQAVGGDVKTDSSFVQNIIYNFSYG